MKKLSKPLLFSMASFFILAANMVTCITSVFMWGEPKCPKDLLK